MVVEDVVDRPGPCGHRTDRELRTVPRRRDRPEASARVFATGAPAVSDMERDATTGELRIVIDVPVTRDGRVVYDLALSVTPQHLQAIVAEQGLPAAGSVRIMDAGGTVGAR